MRQMEQQLVTGGQALEEKEKIAAADRRRLQLDLEQEQARQKELASQNAIKEQELLEKDHKYNNLAEEVDGQRKIIAKLRKNYKNVQAELRDVDRDAEGKYLDLLDQFRAMSKEMDFYLGIA